ncbi:MAG: type IV pilus assembly protein PilM [Patescibacteria group bacterium]
MARNSIISFGGNHPFGLDFGDRSLKLVALGTALVPFRRGSRVRAFGEVAVPDGLSVNGVITEPQKMSELIRALIRGTRGRVRGRSVVASLPEGKTFIKVIEAPAEGVELGAAVRTAAAENFPLPPEALSLDWHTIGGIERGGKKFHRVVIGAAPLELVASYTQIIEDAGLVPVALEIEAMATSRALLPLEEAGGPFVILDIGATHTSLIFINDGAVELTMNIPISGVAITQTIAQALSVPFEKAEETKHECGLDLKRCEGKLRQVLSATIADMTKQIRNALRFYQSRAKESRKIQNIILCGGGGNFRKIDAVLSQALRIKVRRGNPWTNVAPPRDSRLTNAGLGYATAIGLALRGDAEHET